MATTKGPRESGHISEVVALTRFFLMRKWRSFLTLGQKEYGGNGLSVNKAIKSHRQI